MLAGTARSDGVEGCWAAGTRPADGAEGASASEDEQLMGSIRVAWWNLENLFDTTDDPIASDFEYTPEKGWTEAAYAAKKQNLAGGVERAV